MISPAVCHTVESVFRAAPSKLSLPRNTGTAISAGPTFAACLVFETRDQIEEFLKTHNIYEGYALDEINGQVETLERLGF